MYTMIYNMVCNCILILIIHFFPENIILIIIFNYVIVILYENTYLGLLGGKFENKCFVFFVLAILVVSYKIEMYRPLLAND